MDFEVFLAESRKYIVCRALVPITEDTTRRMALAVAELAAATGVLNRLIDVRNVPNTMSVTVNYDMAYKTLEAMHIERSTKVASLQSPDDSTHEFVCIAIRNAGFNLRTFTDEAAASAWLEE
jgi:hypothetical protein